MATSNYKVLTDVDLSNNKLYNTLCIANTEKDSESLLADPDGGDKPLIQTSEDSKSLLIRTDGDTVLAASNLTGKIINGKTSLKTGTSEVVVTNTATENITNSKTTIVATTTTEVIDSFGIDIKTPSQTVLASGKSETISPSVTLATGPLNPDDRSERASITLTKVADNNKGSKVATSAKTIAVDATDTITQTAPTSTYRADEKDVNSLKLTTDDVKLKSDNETITLTKAKDRAAAKTEIHSNNLVVNATAVEVKENKTTSVTSSESVTVKAESSGNKSIIATTPTDMGLESGQVSLTASVTENSVEKSSRIALFPAASAEETALVLSTDKNLKINSVSGTTIGDDASIALKVPSVTETADNSSISLSSGSVVIKNTAGDVASESITLDHGNRKISIAANDAGVDIEGSASSTVTVKGTEFKVSSGKSTFTENSKFNKNVEIVGDLTTKNMSGEAATLNSLDVKATTTVNGTLLTGTARFTSINGADATLKQKLTVEGETTVGEGGATVGTLIVNDEATLTAETGMTAKKAVTVDGTTKVNGTATVGALEVANTATTGTLTVIGDLEAGEGLTSKGLVSIENKKSATTALTVSNTTTTETLTVTGDLSAGKGLKSAGLVDITGESADGKSLTVSGTATTGKLTISDSTLEAKGGLTATGEVSVGSLTASTATVNNLSIPSTSTLEATTKMTSGTVTVTGETSIATITGTGSLKIPETTTLEATNGGTAGSVKVSNIEIKNVIGDGFLKIPPTGTLIADKGGKATTKFEPASIEIKTVMGDGFLKIPETTTLEAVKGGKATEKFEPANIEIKTVMGDGSLKIPEGQTLTAMKGGTINGSMTIGKEGSVATNLMIYGSATIGTAGDNDTTLMSEAKIVANKTLAVTGTATFNSGVGVTGGLVLDGVTIKWDSTLGALTFSKG